MHASTSLKFLKPTENSIFLELQIAKKNVKIKVIIAKILCKTPLLLLLLHKII